MGRRPHLAWNMTKVCNFRCAYCYFPPKDGAPPAPAPEFKNPVVARDILTLLEPGGEEWAIGMTGGEPMLYPGFTDLCTELATAHRLQIDTNLSRTDVVDDFARRVNPARVDDLYVALHIEERERRNAVEPFIANVQTLTEAGFHVVVNYVLHPSLLERYPKDLEYFAGRGVPLTPRPFKGVHEGRVYPAAYGPEAKAYFKRSPRAARKMVYNFKGVPCDAGHRLLRLEPDGTLMRCSGDRTVIGNLRTGAKLATEPRPCAVSRCPCFGIDHVHPAPAQQEFLDGLARYVLGDEDAARLAFSKTLALDPAASNALNNLGLLHLDAGEAERALSLFRSALDLHPANAIYVRNKAAALLAMGRGAEAQQALSGCLTSCGTTTPSSGFDGLLARLRAAATEDGPELAEQVAKLCVDVVPANSQTDVFPAA